MTFEFLSFWFAAPEILGETRLHQLEKYIESGIRTGIRHWENLATIVSLSFATVWMIAVVFLMFQSFFAGNEPVNPLSSRDMLLTLYFPLFFFAILAGLFRYSIGPRLLRILADNSRLRRRSLIVGAFLFIFGFLLQMIGTIQ